MIRRAILAAVFLLFASVAQAQLGTVVPILPNATHRAGDQSFGPVSIPVGAESFFVAITAANGNPGRLDGNQFVKFVVELSVNGGLLWEPIGGADFDTIRQPADFSIALKEPSNAARLMRGTWTLYSGTWRGLVEGQFQ